MSDVSIIKLINGSTLVGKLSVDGDIIEIETKSRKERNRRED